MPGGKLLGARESGACAKSWNALPMPRRRGHHDDQALARLIPPQAMAESAWISAPSRDLSYETPGSWPTLKRVFFGCETRPATSGWIEIASTSRSALTSQAFRSESRELRSIDMNSIDGRISTWHGMDDARKLTSSRRRATISAAASAPCGKETRDGA